MSAIGHVTIGAAGLKNGGTDGGAPGLRPPEAQNGFCGACLRDPTGNKLRIYCAM